MWAGVDNKAATAEKAGEGEAQFAGELNGEAGGSGDGGKDGNSCGDGFLRDFKTGSAADQHEVIGERNELVLKRPADHFVDRVMPAHIFADDEQFAG